MGVCAVRAALSKKTRAHAECEEREAGKRTKEKGNERLEKARAQRETPQTRRGGVVVVVVQYSAGRTK